MSEQLRIILSLRIICKSKLSDLTGFSPYNSIQYLFYKTYQGWTDFPVFGDFPFF